MNHTKPCPVYLPEMSKSQKKRAKSRWDSHWEAWRLEHDPLFITNLTNARKNLERGIVTKVGFLEARKTLAQRSLSRGRWGRPHWNQALAEYWKKEAC